MQCYQNAGNINTSNPQYSPICTYIHLETEVVDRQERYFYKADKSLKTIQYSNPSLQALVSTPKRQGEGTKLFSGLFWPFREDSLGLVLAATIMQLLLPLDFHDSTKPGCSVLFNSSHHAKINVMQ